MGLFKTKEKVEVPAVSNTIADYKIEKLKNGRKMACDGWVYSVQRMDLLIISISSAGIYVVLEAIKYSLEHPVKNHIILKLSGIAFILSIIINLISQLTGQSTNLHHVSWVDEQLLADAEPTIEQKAKIELFDAKASKFHTYTKRFNIASIILLLTGLLLIMSYFYFII